MTFKNVVNIVLCMCSLSLAACERGGVSSSDLAAPRRSMSNADKPSVPRIVFAKGPSKNTFVGGSAEGLSRVERATPTSADAERDHDTDARFRAATKVRPFRALTTESLPDGVLALIFRSPTDGKPGTLLMSTEAVSPEIEHMAWIALNEDIARHPTDGASMQRTIELHKDFSIHFPHEQVLQLQVLTKAPEDAADQVREKEQQATARQAMIDSFKDAPQVTIHGFRARVRQD